MSPTRSLAVLAGSLFALTGCDIGSGSSRSSSVSSSVSCVNDLCTIAVAGDTSGTRLGVFGRGLRVAAIEQGAITVSAQGGEVRIPVGETAMIDGLRVGVIEAGDRSARLEVRRS